MQTIAEIYFRSAVLLVFVDLFYFSVHITNSNIKSKFIFLFFAHWLMKAYPQYNYAPQLVHFTEGGHAH